MIEQKNVLETTASLLPIYYMNTRSFLQAPYTETAFRFHLISIRIATIMKQRTQMLAKMPGNNLQVAVGL